MIDRQVWTLLKPSLEMIIAGRTPDCSEPERGQMSAE